MSAPILYTVLLPTYNEKENLPLIIWLLDKSFKEAGLAYEVVIVEDNSPDGTYEVALKLQTIFGADHIKILKRAGKLGLGSAYKDGLKLASGQFVFLMDADMSHHVRSGEWGKKGRGECNCDDVEAMGVVQCLMCDV